MTEQNNTQQPDVKQPVEVPEQLKNLEKSVQDVGARVDGMLSAVTSSNRTVILLGVVAFVVVFGYLHWLFRNYQQKVFNPKWIASTADEIAQAQLPALAGELEERLKEAAPDVAKSVVKNAIEGVPVLRQELQKATEEQLDKAVGQIMNDLDAMISQVIEEHKADIREAVKSLDDPEKTKKLQADIEASMRKLIEEDFRQELTEYLRIMKALQKKLRRLRESEKLNPEEQFEKEALTTFAIFLRQSMVESGVDPNLGAEKK
ncbi:MAG TPA: hypothetical protein PL033_05515 [Candidatus Brocadiia bacterium]|nr:hypothetical protein [Candidatus Brocadiia bacterium]